MTAYKLGLIKPRRHAKSIGRFHSGFLFFALGSRYIGGTVESCFILLRCELSNDYRLGKYYPRYAYASGNYFVNLAY